jgi:hypothetical protein
MAERKTNFLESVTFLRKCHDLYCQKKTDPNPTNAQLPISSLPMKPQHDPRDNNPPEREKLKKMQNPPPYRHHLSKPVAIGEILCSAGFHASTQDPPSSPQQPLADPPNTQELLETPSDDSANLYDQLHNPIMQRIVKLEQKIEHLSHQFEKIQSIVPVQKRAR